MTKPMKSSIATSDASSVTLRGLDLVSEVMGRFNFTEVIYLHLAGRFPTKGEANLLDACLVTIMEHGVTPSSIITRLMADSVPDQLQVAVAAGLNAVGSVFIGTMEGCGRILQAGIDAPDPDAYCRGVIDEMLAAGKRMPGFGHPFHKPDDPRTPRLLEIARENNLYGKHCDLLLRLNAALDAASGKHMTINATGGVAALLLEAGLSPDIFRGIAVISRSAGLVAHVQEERKWSTARKIWSLVDENTDFEAPTLADR